jgi:hypothetical protein
MRPKSLALLLTVLTACVLPSCARVSLEGGDKPIHIVHDVNIRIDQQLEQFFAFQHETQPASTTAPAPAATQPVSLIK